jgi:hypothetical protein
MPSRTNQYISSLSNISSHLFFTKKSKKKKSIHGKRENKPEKKLKLVYPPCQEDTCNGKEKRKLFNPPARIIRT